MQPVNIEYEEDVDGIRFNWNRWPSSRVELEKIVLTLGCLYTPLKEPSDISNNVELFQTPLICCRTTCKAILNPYCYPDLQSQHKGWICNFCNQRNQFPQQYQHIMQPNQIRELTRSTIDYTLPNQPIKHPLFVYVIDSSVEEEEFAALKSSIISSVRLLPPNAQVALITFNHIVYVWELHNNKGRSFVFDGDKDYKPKQIQDWLGLTPHNQGQQQQLPTATPANRPMPYTNGHPQQPPTMMNSSYPNQYQPPRAPNAMNQPYVQNSANFPAAPMVNQQNPIRQNRFIRQASQVESIFEAKLEGVSKNTWPTPTGRRPLRAVGAAISMAINISEITYQNSGGRIMLFLGGPCTVGPGMIVDDDLKNTIRTHHDIDKDNAKYMKKATDYYNHLASRAANNGHAIDIFSCAYDQTGLSEMKCCTNMTNGMMVMCDSFGSNLFKMSFERIFSKDGKGNLKMAFNALLDVKTSRELKVSGAIGSCISMNRRTQYVADKKDGISGTSQWKFCSLTPNSCTAFYYVVQNSPTVSQAQQYPCGYVQFVTNYQGSDGYRHVRVTTTRRQFGTDDLEFDQESAVVLLARMACHRSDANEGSGQEILRWLDKSLVRVCQKFGDYHSNSPESFRLKDPFCMFPIFLFNLRRSQFIQVFNNSPDETTFYRHSLMREDCLNSLLMIQPSLMAYDINNETKPVSLDTSSIQPDRILLMDTFFQIVIFHCERIAAWKRHRYQDQPEYQWFKQFLEVPIKDANELMLNRFPLPRYVVCDQGDSQSRFLLSKVNPSVTHNTAYGDANSAPVLSDDVSYGVFEEHLKKLTVSSAA